MAESTEHFMYVLRCVDGTLYTGYTTDVEQRLCNHNVGKGAKYTAARRPVTLVAQAAFATKHAAMSAEFHFKQLKRDQKEQLLEDAPDAESLAALLIERFGIVD